MMASQMRTGYQRGYSTTERLIYKLLVLLIVASTFGNFGLAPVYAASGNGGYPWAQARATGFGSDWFVDENNNSRYDGAASSESFDPYGFAYRNCTSYVAWRLHNAGFTVPYGRALGNAKTWADNARALGFHVDGNPRAGDVAVWTSGLYGHVAFVEAVNGDGSVNVSEYNALPAYAGLYSARNGVRATAYIHFPVALAAAAIPAAAAVEPTPAVVLPRSEAAAPVTSTTPAVNVPVPDFSDARLFSADINGDHKGDLVTIAQDATTNEPMILWQLASASGFDAYQYVAAPVAKGVTPTWLTADVSGDGHDDVIAVIKNGAQLNIYAFVANGSSLTATTAWGGVAETANVSNILSSDRDGDGKHDLVVVSASASQSAPALYWLHSTGTSFEPWPATPAPVSAPAPLPTPTPAPSLVPAPVPASASVTP